jgi:hypothetical protein
MKQTRAIILDLKNRTVHDLYFSGPVETSILEFLEAVLPCPSIIILIHDDEQNTQPSNN